MKKILTILLLAVLTSGCVKETTHEKMTERVKLSSMNTFMIGVQYVGSDNTHDYFYLDIPFGKNEICKIIQKETLVKERFELTKDSTKWVTYDPPFKFGDFDPENVITNEIPQNNRFHSITASGGSE
jgi:uncharacterized protein YceK